MEKNGRVIRIEDRPHQERVFLHIEADDGNGGYGTVVSFSYSELEQAGKTDFEKFMGFECECDPYPHREDFGVLPK